MLSKEIIENMNYIVEKCIGEDSAACVTKCPMHCDAKEYIKLIKEDNGDEAINVIRETLFIPGILGRVCAHPCETSCRRGKEDDPLSIAKLKRYIVDNFDNEENWDLTKENPTFKKIAIIGGGPASGQAAYTLSKKGHSVTIYEKNMAIGGILCIGVPAYRLPRNIVAHEFSILEKLGVNIKLGVDIGKDITFENICKEYDAILVSVGRQIGRVDKSLEHSDAIGIHSALDFLKSVAQSKSCENIGKTVTVVGGGDVAIDCARSALRLSGVKKVNIISLEDSGALPASPIEIKEALEENIEFYPAYGINKISIDNNNKVTGIKLKKCLYILDENNRFAPKFDETITKNIQTDSIIFAVGQGVDFSFDAKNIMSKKPNGTFDADPITLQTSNEKIFIAGDCASSVIVVGAMSEGHKAAISIDRYVRGLSLTENRVNEDEVSYETKLLLTKEYLPQGWDSIEKTKRFHPMTEDIKKRITNFDEVEKVYTTEEALKEANRCLQCECRLCIKECLFLDKYTSSPKVLFTEYLEKGYEYLDIKIAFSCNDCTQCTLRCPHDFNIQDNFIEMKKDHVAKLGGYSDFPGHIALDDGQELECSTKYCFNIVSKKNPKYVFIPGCTVPASLPEEVEKVVYHLENALGEEVSTILRCCGRPTEMICETDIFNERYSRVQKEIEDIGADTIITVCPSCFKTYSAYSGKNMITYWELMKEKIGIPKSQINIGKNSDVIFNIHDSCVTRSMTTHHDGVRWVLEELGYKYEEMNFNKENTRCCGVGGMLSCVDSELFNALNARRTADATQDHIVTYCGSCRGSMENGEKDAIHILELLFRDTPYMKLDAHKRSDNYGFHNRMDTKNRLIEISKKM